MGGSKMTAIKSSFKVSESQQVCKMLHMVKWHTWVFCKSCTLVHSLESLESGIFFLHLFKTKNKTSTNDSKPCLLKRELLALVYPANYSTLAYHLQGKIYSQNLLFLPRPRSTSLFHWVKVYIKEAQYKTAHLLCGSCLYVTIRI